MLGRLLKFSFSLLLSLLIISLILFVFYFKYSIDYVPLNIQPNGHVLMVTPGLSSQRIAQRLADEGVLQHPQCFLWWVHISGARLKLKAGEYLIKPGMTAQGLIDLLISGKVIQHSLTIVEGWTFDRLIRAIQQEPKLSHTLAGLSSAEIMAKLGHPGEYPEGLFFPDTYYFPAGTTDLAFLQRAYKRLQTKLMEVWKQREKQGDQNDFLLKTPYDILVLASIIEKESNFPEEYAEISGVYHRRLKLKMPLQADPTVVYGVGLAYQNQSTGLTNEQLKRKTAYNTYLVAGLPPTPIAFPGEKALWAAAHPKPGDTLYFVAKGEGKGHVFSKTLAEHLAAVAVYRKKLKALNELRSAPAQEEASKTAGSTANIESSPPSTPALTAN